MMQDRRSRILTLGSLVVLVGGVSLTLWLTRGEGRVGDEAYDYALALYRACNQRDTDQVAKIQDMLAESVAAGRVSKRENRVLGRILDDAQRGRWSQAQRQALRLLEDQVARVE